MLTLGFLWPVFLCVALVGKGFGFPIQNPDVLREVAGQPLYSAAVLSVDTLQSVPRSSGPMGFEAITASQRHNRAIIA